MIDVSSLCSHFSELKNIQLLVQSGQKQVFTAYKNDKMVVLKLVKKQPPGRDRLAASRLEREIAAVTMLSSEHVPKIMEHGCREILGQERHYIIEQYVDGGNYRDFLRRTPIPPLIHTLEVARVLLGSCRDFESKQLVHRDIKPENIMIDSSGKIWVIDFGLVRFLEMESLTQTGAHFGPFTPGYGAPEQVRNLKTQIDVRADLFSTGVVIYESLSGINPYLVGKHDPLEVIRHMEQRDLPRLSLDFDPSGELSDFVAAMTSRFPSRRPQTASDAIDWFTGVAANLRARTGE